jgi:uncharacterized protein YpmB
VLKLEASTQVYLSLHVTDMRCGIFSLASQVESVFSKNSKDGSLYVFVSKDKKKIKIIAYPQKDRPPVIRKNGRLKSKRSAT